MSFSSKLVGFAALASIGLTACGVPNAAPANKRTFIERIEPEVPFEPEEQNGELYVDSFTRELGACEWQKKLEDGYRVREYTGRFRHFGYVELRKPPKDSPSLNPLRIFSIILELVDFVLPGNVFGGVKVPRLDIHPWGRVDMKANSINSYALMTEGANQIPTREEFLAKVNQVLTQRPTGYLKLLAFKTALLTGVINADEKRNEIVQEEMEKVFPGYFSADGTQSLLESFSWVLVSNALRQESDFELKDLKVFERPLPVFRVGGWKALSEDMRRGLGAAIGGLQSNRRNERACAANILFRSTEQLIQLMGQETLPLYNSDRNQSYAPSLSNVLTGNTSQEFQKCASAGSIIKGGRRRVMTESELSRLSRNSDKYSFAEKPMPINYCTPGGSMSASAPRPSKTGSALATMLDRMDAFGHYLFAFNPAASWWRSSGPSQHPMGSFNGMKQIQDSKSLVPMKIHALPLAFLQLDLLHFEGNHLVFLNEAGERTLDQNEAVGVRLSEDTLGSRSETAVTKLSSALHFLELLGKFDAYLASLERWSKNASSSKIRGFFVERDNLKAILGSPAEPNRKKIEQLYLALSLLLMEYVDKHEAGVCYDTVTTQLESGEEALSGDCGAQRKPLARGLMKLAVKLKSPLLKRRAEQVLDGAR